MRKLIIGILLFFISLGYINSQSIYFMNKKPVNGTVDYSATYDWFYSYYDNDFIYALVKSDTKFNAYKITFALYLKGYQDYQLVDVYSFGIKPSYNYAFTDVSFSRFYKEEERYYKVEVYLDDDDYPYVIGYFRFDFR